MIKTVNMFNYVVVALKQESSLFFLPLHDNAGPLSSAILTHFFVPGWDDNLRVLAMKYLLLGILLA